MEPISLDYCGKKGFVLVHRCRSCHHVSRNRVAPDDDLDAMLAILRDDVPK
jgi:hypothetical protein